MTDRAGDISFQNAWSTLAGRVAAGAGALVALCAVLADVPVRIACLRGALTFFGISVIAGLGLRVIQRGRGASEVDGEVPVEDAS